MLYVKTKENHHEAGGIILDYNSSSSGPISSVMSYTMRITSDATCASLDLDPSEFSGNVTNPPALATQSQDNNQMEIQSCTPNKATTFRNILCQQNQMLITCIDAMEQTLMRRGYGQARLYAARYPQIPFPTITLENSTSKLSRTPSSHWKICHSYGKVDDDKFSSKKSVIITPIDLPPITLFPPYSYWSNISISEGVDDFPILKHIPYFGEDEKVPDLEFYLEHYTHMDIPSESEHEDDTVIDSIYDSLLQGSEDAWTQRVLVSSLNTDIARLNRRKELRQLAIVDQKSFNARQDPQDSFYSLFCKHCYVYDCPLHPVSTCHYPRAKRLKKVSLPAICHFPPCHKNFCADKIQDPWTGEEEKRLEKALQVLVGVPSKNICLLASLVYSKSCAQVALRLEEPVNTIERSRPMIVDLPSYFPGCSHGGSGCYNSNCSCHLAGRKCSKFCMCDERCKNMVAGCLCKTGCNNRACPCLAANRECDPDRCKSCRSCNNMAIQNQKRKRLLIGVSDIAGWGIFAGEDIKSGEMICEYTGEVVSQEEAERRGIIYDIRRTSFLFNLDHDFVVDATYKGSKVRFANHSDCPNATSKVMDVLGTLRIGIFASSDIHTGEEITFHYNYSSDVRHFISKRKS